MQVLMERDVQCCDRYFYPDIIHDLRGHPLYIAIAIWGIRTSQLLTTEKLCREFLISQRNANDILHYIQNEGSQYIKFERLRLKPPSGRTGFRRALRILDAVIPPPQIVTRRKKNAKRHTSPNASTSGPTLTDFQRLRRWMVSRKPGDTVNISLFNE